MTYPRYAHAYEAGGWAKAFWTGMDAAAWNQRFTDRNHDLPPDGAGTTTVSPAVGDTSPPRPPPFRDAAQQAGAPPDKEKPA